MSKLLKVRTWYVTHQWSSLICTLFLFVLCLTGLPLIFGDEIDDWLENQNNQTTLQARQDNAAAPAPTFDALVDLAQHKYPGEVPRWIVLDKDGNVNITLAPSQDADPKQNHWIRFDAGTGSLLKESPGKQQPMSFMQFMTHLHTDLFAGLSGELFLGAMGLLFVVAIVSGVVLYGPFMKNLEFAEIRAERGSRIKWLDLHNLLGIAVLAWSLVVGATGIINELSTPLFSLWRATEVTAMLAPYHGKPMPASFSPVQRVVDNVHQALPGKTIFSVVYPEPKFGSPYHYLVWVKGDTPLTSRLFTPLLIDAVSGEIVVIAQLPWYIKALEVSRPLHFGDYGGLPLKILWAIFDLATIFVLGSGLYLWIARRAASRRRRRQLAA